MNLVLNLSKMRFRSSRALCPGTNCRGLGTVLAEEMHLIGTVWLAAINKASLILVQIRLRCVRVGQRRASLLYECSLEYLLVYLVNSSQSFWSILDILYSLRLVLSRFSYFSLTDSNRWK